MKEHIFSLLEKMNILSGGTLISVNLMEYVEKILQKATIISISQNHSLVAFIAYYDNDPEKKTAYLTMIVVDDDAKGLGYGKNLIELSIANLKKQNFINYRLEVHKNNINALRLYENLGFKVEEYRGDSIYMSLQL